MTPREFDKKLGEAVSKAQVTFLPQILGKKNNTNKGAKK